MNLTNGCDREAARVLLHVHVKWHCNMLTIEISRVSNKYALYVEMTYCYGLEADNTYCDSLSHLPHDTRRYAFVVIVFNHGQQVFSQSLEHEAHVCSFTGCLCAYGCLYVRLYSCMRGFVLLESHCTEPSSSCRCM